MANERYTLIKESLKRLLQEGCKYLHIVDKFYHRSKNDYSEFQRVLHMLDNYSRHKAALQQDIELLNEKLGNVPSEDSDYDDYDDYYNYDNYDDYLDGYDGYDGYDDYFDDDDYDEETGDDETVSADGGYDSFEEWVNQLTSAIREKKHFLTRLELILLGKVESYSNLMQLQSQLNNLLQNYCERVDTVLNQMKSVVNRVKMNTRLANRFRENLKKLGEILAYIKEKQKFFWGDHTSAMETA